MQSFLSLEIPLAIFICIIYIFAALTLHVLQDRYGYSLWFHESSFSCIVGFLIGGILKVATGSVVIFNGDLFFFMILPPIIFAAGYSLRRKRFFQNIHLILLFGIGGTVVNFLFIALGAYYFSTLFPNYHLGAPPFSWQKSLLFASVLAGSDEVSALSLVPSDVFPRMGALIFGEGVMNDALSIVLFESLKPLDAGDRVEFTTDNLLKSISIQLVGSVGIGCVTGLILSMIMKRFTNMLGPFPAHQTALVMLFGYLSYAVAQCMEISGILTVFVCAVTMAHYAWHSLSKQAQVATRLSSASLSEIAEGFAFSYVGLSYWSYANSDFYVLFAVYMITVVLLARAVTTFGIAGFLNWQRIRSFEMTLSEQHGLFLGGIVRGCLCWAQVLQLRHCPVLVTTTLLIIMVTSISSGVLLPMLLPRLLKNNDIASLDIIKEEKERTSFLSSSPLPPLLIHQHHSPMPPHPLSLIKPLPSKIQEQEMIRLIRSTPVRQRVQRQLQHHQGHHILQSEKKTEPVKILFSSKSQQHTNKNQNNEVDSSMCLSSSQMYHTALDIEEQFNECDVHQHSNQQEHRIIPTSTFSPATHTAGYSPIHSLALNSPSSPTLQQQYAFVNNIKEKDEDSSPPIVLASMHNKNANDNNNEVNNNKNGNYRNNESMVIFEQSSWTSQEIRTASYLFLQWIRFDETVMKPWFGGSLPDHNRKRWLREIAITTSHNNNNSFNNVNNTNNNKADRKPFFNLGLSVFPYQRIDDNKNKNNNENSFILEDQEDFINEMLHQDDDVEDRLDVLEAELDAEEVAEKENLLSPFVKLKLRQMNRNNHNNSIFCKKKSFYDNHLYDEESINPEHHYHHYDSYQQSSQDTQDVNTYSKKNVSFADRKRVSSNNFKNDISNNNNANTSMLISQFPPTFQLPLDDEEDDVIYANHSCSSSRSKHAKHPITFTSPTSHSKVRPIARGLFFHSPVHHQQQSATAQTQTVATELKATNDTQIENKGEAKGILIEEEDDDVCLYSTTPILPGQPLVLDNKMASQITSTNTADISNKAQSNNRSEKKKSKTKLIIEEFVDENDQNDASFLSPITIVASPPRKSHRK